MLLTTENAARYVGKKLYGGPFHHWPLTVKLGSDGRFYVVDRTHTMTYVPGPEDHFNTISFNRVED